MTAPSPPIAATALVEAVEPSVEPAPGAGAGSRTLRLRQEAMAWAGLIPFFVFLGLFLLVPTVSVFRKAFAQTEDSDVPAMREAMSGSFRGYFTESLQLSAVSALLGGVIGTVLALVVGVIGPYRDEPPGFFNSTDAQIPIYAVLEMPG
jgi:ABC-type Fe3+ transport system permease subunit